ncbi:transposase [uncultured Parabacteroides sp.]|uniref:transposase n=1 Tax=uncultured Parabacteroides sp. TaxID=512312 RepID=UPI003452C839
MAVFNSRYGTELNRWLKDNSQISLVTRDGSHDYARAISENLPQAVQVSDRFHLVKNLFGGVIDSIQKMLYQSNGKQPYPYPTAGEAYEYMFKALCGISEKTHREQVNNYLKIKKMISEGVTTTVTECAICPVFHLCRVKGDAVRFQGGRVSVLFAGGKTACQIG